jgi:hypothetical protein
MQYVNQPILFREGANPGESEAFKNLLAQHGPRKPIDHRRADGRFLMSPRDMAVSNTRYLSSSETRVNAGMRGWKLNLSEST